MRRLVLATIATLSLLAAGSLAPGRAVAMTLATPAGIGTAIDHSEIAKDVAQKVAYVCRRVWRCGPYGCGWRQRCSWTPRRHWRGYWHGGRYWRHRAWRHHRWHYY